MSPGRLLCPLAAMVPGSHPLCPSLWSEREGPTRPSAGTGSPHLAGGPAGCWAAEGGGVGRTPPRIAHATIQALPSWSLTACVNPAQSPSPQLLPGVPCARRPCVGPWVPVMMRSLPVSTLMELGCQPRAASPVPTHEPTPSSLGGHRHNPHFPEEEAKSLRGLGTPQGGKSPSWARCRDQSSRGLPGFHSLCLLSWLPSADPGPGLGCSRDASQGPPPPHSALLASVALLTSRHFPSASPNPAGSLRRRPSVWPSESQAPRHGG